MKIVRESLFESPDGVISSEENNIHMELRYEDEDALAFGYDTETGNMLVGKDTHADLIPGKLTPRQQFEYPGRVWVIRKILSFWVYPDPEFFFAVANDLNRAINKFRSTSPPIDIMNDEEWRIEVIQDAAKPDKFYDGNEFSDTEYSRSYSKLTSQEKKEILIPIRDYVGSRKRTAAQLAAKHRESPLVKRQRGQQKVPQGFGSKHPKAEDRTKWKMALATESLLESFLMSNISDKELWDRLDVDTRLDVMVDATKAYRSYPNNALKAELKLKRSLRNELEGYPQIDFSRDFLRFLLSLAEKREQQ